MSTIAIGFLQVPFNHGSCGVDFVLRNIEKADIAWFMMAKIKKPVMISWNHDPQKLNLHSLRKGYGSNMAELCPPHTLRELMGHISIVTTMEYYVQDVDENKKKAVEGLVRMMEE